MSDSLKSQVNGSIIKNLPNEEYHAIQDIGSTSVKRAGKSMAHLQYELRNPKPQTPAMFLGSATDLALLEPHLFESEYLVAPKFVGLTKDGRESSTSKEALDKKAAWYAANQNKKILDADQMENIKGMVHSVYSHQTAKKLLNLGHSQDSYFWTDPVTGVKCKCRPDFLREGKIIIDLKTTVDASPNEFSKSVFKYGYHISAAWYLDGVSLVTGQEYDTFILLAVESAAPYGVAIYYLDQAAIQVGRDYYRAFLEKYAACLETGIFPGYDEHINTISIPAWGFKS